MTFHYNGSIRVKKLAVGSYNTNVYLVTCTETCDSVLIDAAAELDRIIAAAEGTKVRQILLTHGHGDHIGVLGELQRALDVPVGINAADAGMLRATPDFHIQDGDVIQVGNQTLTAIHTPGHTPGGMCFYQQPVLFSGDTLFPGGPGATGHRLGNFDQIIDSIRQKLFVLPDETYVLPGHGLDTKLGLERPSLEEWIARRW